MRASLTRAKLRELIAAVPLCLIGMEACSGAYQWAREFAKFGNTVRLMASKFVARYRMSGKRGKNDAADAAAISDLRSRPADCKDAKRLLDKGIKTGALGTSRSVKELVSPTRG